jgi:hypothetical protein
MDGRRPHSFFFCQSSKIHVGGAIQQPTLFTLKKTIVTIMIMVGGFRRFGAQARHIEKVFFFLFFFLKTDACGAPSCI